MFFQISLMMSLLWSLGFVASADAKSPLFTSHMCHPKITPACTLYYHANADLDGGEISYSDLATYYQQVSNGLIRENPESIILQNSKYQPLADQNRASLRFQFNTRKMTLTPVQDLAPETVQKLFVFDSSMFMNRMGAADFNTAKKKHYELTRFSRWKLNFDRDILLPTDWRSLIHPPMYTLKDIGATPASAESTGAASRAPASVNTVSGAPSGNSAFWGKDYHLTLDSETRTELTQGNQLRLMVNNESYSEKIKLVKEAKRYVHVAVMSFAYTQESRKIIDALIERARAGLDVRVIMEKVWGKVAFNKTIKTLRKNGVKVALADDFLRFGRNQGLFHSKYFVIDGERGVVGGQNLVDRSHKASGYNHFNKDTDVRVEGPILTDMHEDYAKLWERFTRQSFPTEYKKEVLTRKEAQRQAGMRGTENYSKWLSNQEPGLCRFISQGPHEDKYKLSKAYFETFARAEKNILMTTQIVNFQKHPIGAPNWITKIYRKVFEKAKSGVSVDLITNGIDGGFLKTYPKTDSPLERFFTRGMNDVTGYLNTALRRGKLEALLGIPNFTTWQHFQYIHSKVAIADDTVSVIGSYNFETVSAEGSHETAVFCQDQGLTNALKDDLNLTIANSTPLF
jgi:phosphatidylserine/phosphatidylglycerophosphate/cardiolipin synthase-like enzyme